ncbi:MAG TPA: hypothetical protein VK507_24275 [Iamia sp.]|nr:hypothetical protein [Iamia sp.]
MTETVQWVTTLALPDVWEARSREGFDDLFTALAAVPDVDRDFVALLEADVRPIVQDAAAQGLVLLAGFMESIDDPPVELDASGLQVPFDQDDVAPVAVAASLALFDRAAPEGSIDDLAAALEGAEGRWLARPERAELPIGPAIVTREVQAVHPPSLKRASDVMLVTYHVLPREHPDTVLVALFRTPSLGFAEEFDAQFAAIASTLQIVESTGTTR